MLALAKDEDLVASPILRLSEVLKPEDFVAIIQSQKSHAKMAAIAERRGVPPIVSLALIGMVAVFPSRLTRISPLRDIDRSYL